MKIICGTDFSESAVQASRVAARLAARFGDSLVLANVVEPPTTMYPEIMVDARIFENAMREAAGSALTGAADGLRRLGVEVETQVVDGKPADALADLARQISARLIVVGTHGRRVLGRALLDTVADRLAKLADRPSWSCAFRSVTVGGGDLPHPRPAAGAPRARPGRALGSGGSKAATALSTGPPQTVAGEPPRHMGCNSCDSRCRNVCRPGP